MHEVHFEMKDETVLSMTLYHPNLQFVIFKPVRDHSHFPLWSKSTECRNQPLILLEKLFQIPICFIQSSV